MFSEFRKSVSFRVIFYFSIFCLCLVVFADLLFILIEHQHDIQNHFIWVKVDLEIFLKMFIYIVIVTGLLATFVYSLINITILKHLKCIATFLNSANTYSKQKSLELNRAYKNDELQSLVNSINSYVERSFLQNKDLLENDRKFRSIFYQPHIPMVIADTFGNILFANSAYENLLGYTIEELTHFTLYDITHKEDHNQQHAALHSPIPYISYEKKYIHKNGDPIFTRITGCMLTDENGHVYALLGIAENLNKQKENEQEKLILQRQLIQHSHLAALRTLGAGISHELNNPLAVINGYAQQALQKFEHQETADKFVQTTLQKILQHTERIENIVKHIQDFSRDPEAQPLIQIDPAQIIQTSLDFFRTQLKNYDIEVIQSFDPLCPRFIGNAIKIESVIQNLLINARESFDNFASEGTVRQIIISCFPKDSFVVIEIKDTGRGIPPYHLDKIFNPFFTTKDIGKGNGLGLSIAHGIVREHRGQIQVTSQVNVGSTFTLLFPAEMIHELI